MGSICSLFVFGASKLCFYLLANYLKICTLDYVGFIKKVMKLLQHGFPSIRKVEVTLAQLEESQAPPPARHCEYHTFYI
jgi:hypothetical protein